MDDDKPASSRINWSAVSRIYHNLPVIWFFLMTWADINKQFTPYELINLYKVCWDIVWLLQNEEMKKFLLNGLGKVYKRIRRFNSALECFNQVLEMNESTGNFIHQQEAYNGIGSVYTTLRKYEEAIQCYEKALQIYQQTGDLAGEGDTLIKIGNAHLAQDNYDEAITYFEKSLQICRRIGLPGGEGRALNNIGILYESRGEYEEAIKCYEESLQMLKQTGDLAGVGKTLHNIGDVHQSRGKYEDAINSYNDALNILRLAGDLSGQGKALNSTGNVYQFLGEFDEAMKSYNGALKISRKTGDLAGEGNALNNIGIVHQSRKEHGKATECFKNALQIFRGTRDMAGEGKALHSIRNVHHLLGKYEEAAKFYKESLYIFRQTGDLVGEGKALINIEGNALNNIGIVHQSRKEHGKATECFKNALLIFRGTRDMAGEGKALHSIGNVHHLLGKYEEAAKFYKESLYIFRQTGDLVGEGKALINIGIVHETHGEDDKAVKYSKDALQIYRETGQLLEEAKTCNNLGILLISTHDLDAAENHLRESISCHERIFSMLSKHCPSKVSIVDTYITTYQMLTCVLLTLGKYNEALLTSESRRSQALRDELLDKYGLSSPAAHYEDLDLLISSSSSIFVTYFLFPFSRLFIFLSSSINEVTVEWSSKDDFIRRDSKDEQDSELQTVISSYVKRLIKHANEYLRENRDNTFEDRSLGQTERKVSFYEKVRGDMTMPLEKIFKELLFLTEEPTEQRNDVGTGTGASAEKHDDPKYESQVSSSSGMNMLGEEHGHVIDTAPKHLETTSDGDELMNDLYKLLIAPIEDQLDQSEITIIPDGPLFFVPFAALQAPSGQYLSETKRIRIGPSLSTLKILKEYPVEKQSTTGALIVGDPRVENVMWDGEFCEKPFDNLPHACNEALQIACLLHVKPLIRSAATKPVVMSQLREGVALIHFATHGDGDIGKLLLAPAPRDDNTVPAEIDYLLSMEEISSCNINAQLVVLSGCHTGTGEIRAEGVMSLARAFLVAGARSVLATLWEASDEGTLYFMNSFYRHLTSGKSACTSLQEAMREMRGDPEFSHWAYWAPFFIIGHDVTPFGGSDVTT